MKAEETTVKDQEGEEYLKKASCIVLISNVPEEEDGDIDLMRTYKDQQVVENSFRELKSPGHGIGDLLKEPGNDQGIKYAAVPVIADPCSNPVPDEGRAERNPKRETRCKTTCGLGREGAGKANLQAAVRAQRKLLF